MGECKLHLSVSEKDTLRNVENRVIISSLGSDKGFHRNVNAAFLHLIGLPSQIIRPVQ